MEMKPNLVLNLSSFKVFVKMTKAKGFLNPNNQSQDQTKGTIKNQKKTTKNNGDFKNQELDKIGNQFMNNDLWVLLSTPLQHHKTKQQQIYKKVKALKSSLPSSIVFQTNAPIIQEN